MKQSNLTIAVIILAFPAQTLIGQVSSFPYSQDFTSDPLGGDWTVNKTGLVSNHWTHSAADGNPDGCLKLTSYVTSAGDQNYLDLALNTSDITFAGDEILSYEIFRETGALGNATVVVQHDASGSFVDIAASSYSVNDLTATTWTPKAVSLPSEMQNKTDVKIRLKISGSDLATFNNLRFDNASVSGGVLPVQMISFAAVANGFDVNLRWSTATEVNNYGFEIERRNVRTGQQRWSVVGFARGAGTSTSPRDYSYTDASLSPGRYAYRIRQIDRDGGSSYVSVTEVEVSVMPKVFALEPNYPNPFNPSTEIRFHIPRAQLVVLNVYDLLGQQVAALVNDYKQPGTYTTSFDGSYLPSGVYFYRLRAGEFNQSRTFILQK